MILRIAGTTSMCSTLILSGLGCYASLAKTVSDLKRAVKAADGRRHKETVYSPWEASRTAEVDLLRGHKVDQFAFITCTLYSDNNNYDSQEVVMENLITLGFKKTHPKPVYNEKNGTSVWMLAAPVPRILKNLKKYDDNGFLIVKTKKGGVSPSVASAA